MQAAEWILEKKRSLNFYQCLPWFENMLNRSHFFKKLCEFFRVDALSAREQSQSFFLRLPFFFAPFFFPSALHATDMGGIIIVIVWLMLDAPMFILYLIQLIFALYFLRKENISRFVSVINKILFGAGIVFGILALLVHLIFLLDMIKNAGTRNAMAFSLLIYAVILALSIFSGKKSLDLMKKPAA